MRKKNAKIKAMFKLYHAPKIEICGDDFSSSWQMVTVGCDTYIEHKLWRNDEKNSLVCHDRQICDATSSVKWIYSGILDDVLECFNPYVATGEKLRLVQEQLNEKNYMFIVILGMLGRDYNDFIADLFYMWTLWQSYPEFKTSHYMNELSAGGMTPELRLVRQVMSRLEPKQLVLSVERQNGVNQIEKTTFISVLVTDDYVFWSRADALTSFGLFNYEMFADDQEAGYFKTSDADALSRLCDYIVEVTDDCGDQVAIDDDGACDALGVVEYLLSHDTAG